MTQIIPYLFGGLTVLLVMDVAPSALPSMPPAGVTAPAVLKGTPGTSVNREAKGDRTAVVRSTQPASRPTETVHDQVRDRKPVQPNSKPMLGCEPSFSPVASPSLAHHIGRCMAALGVPQSQS